MTVRPLNENFKTRSLSLRVSRVFLPSGLAALYVTSNAINSNSAHFKYRGLAQAPLAHVSKKPRVCVSGDQPHVQGLAPGRGSRRAHRGLGPDWTVRALLMGPQALPCHLPGSRPGGGAVQPAVSPPGTSWFGSRTGEGRARPSRGDHGKPPSLSPSRPDGYGGLAECPGRPPGQGQVARTFPKLFVVFKPRRGSQGLRAVCAHACSYTQAHG